MAWLQTSRGKYYVCWREGGRDSPIKVQAAGTRLGEARRMRDVIAGRVREGRVGGGVIAKRITVREFADEWLPIREQLLRPKSFERERYIVKNHIVGRFGKDMVHGVTAKDAQAFITGITKTVSAWSARRVHDVARIMFGDAQRYGYCRENVFWNVRRPETPHHEMRILGVGDFCRLLEALPLRHRPFVLTLGLSGLRYGEATGLQWPDADLDERRLHVRRQIVSNTTKVAKPKSQHSVRTVEIPAVLASALKDTGQRSEWMFPGARKGPQNHRAFDRRVWLPTVRALELDGLRLHDLRHFAASLWLSWGRNPLWVAAQLGHESAAFTMRQYGHLLREGQRLDEADTLRRIEEAYRCAKPVPSSRGRNVLDAGRGGRI